MDKRITIDLTEVEAGQLGEILNIAIKAGGLQIAMVAIPIFEKIRTAAQSAILVPHGTGRVSPARS